MTGKYNPPSVQIITNILKKEIAQIISDAENLKTGEGSYKTFTYNTIQFVVACWMTPTGLKVRYKVFNQILASLDDVIYSINNYWNNYKRKPRHE